MKKYLIRIEANRSAEAVYINGDSLRPFQIAHNLWNYTTPWTAAQRLEKLAKAWEGNGFSVRRVYGTVADMPTKGNEFNLAMIKSEWCGVPVAAGSLMKNLWKIKRPQRKSSVRQEMRLDAGRGLWPLKQINMWRIEDKRLAKSWPLVYTI